MTKAETFFAAKVNFPTALTTAELELLPLQLRQRAFFMAQVTHAEILQVFRETTHETMAGDLSIQEARRMLREKLAALGYEPDPTEVGGIHDLSAPRRQNLVLETNLSMARNYAAEQAQLRAIKAFPAKQLVRLQNRLEPRDWETRWADAYAGLSDTDKKGASLDPAVAVVGSPIWAAISRFGAPYAPFDFNSGMGTRAVGRTAALAAGLTLPAPPAAAATPAPAASFNAGLQSTPRVSDPGIMAGLGKALAGMAAWVGPILEFVEGVAE